jgi:methionine aminopeptidase
MQNIKLTDPLTQLDDTSLIKYKTAGIIVTKIIDSVTKEIKPNRKLIDIYNIGIDLVKKECDKVYQDIKYKGLAFPFCISKNNITGHYIPTNLDVVNDGDIIKLEIGVHIDGYPVSICYSTFVPNNNHHEKQQKVMKTVINASKEIIKMMTPEHSNLEISNILKKYASQNSCNLLMCDIDKNVPGIFSYQMSRHILDGYNEDSDEYAHGLVLSKDNPNYGFSLRETYFEENEIYAIDIAVSSGNGKLSILKEPDIYKRKFEEKADLKLKSSKAVVSLFKDMFPTIVNMKDPKIRLGLKECLAKNLIEPYYIVAEKENEFIARVKFTVIIKNEPILLCGKSGDSELAKFIS